MFIFNFIEQYLPILRFVLRGSDSVGWRDRLRISRRIDNALKRNRGRSASTLGEQLVLVDAVLSIPESVPGAIAEFGCYKGLSSVALSIAAKYSGRRLMVFDSFEGLPESTEVIRHIAENAVVTYKKGDFSGALEEVRSVIARHGEIDRVEFIKGYFCDTLPKRPADEKYALIFEDADLAESVRDILVFAWPKLQDGGFFFSHEALGLEVVKLFYDNHFWKETHGVSAPGLAGAGLGLPIDRRRCGAIKIPGSRGSNLGFFQKRTAVESIQSV